MTLTAKATLPSRIEWFAATVLAGCSLLHHTLPGNPPDDGSVAVSEAHADLDGANDAGDEHTDCSPSSCVDADAAGRDGFDADVLGDVADTVDVLADISDISDTSDPVDVPTNITCTGDSCVCRGRSTCEITGSLCGTSNCSLHCPDNSNCLGTCGASCSIDCTGNSTCDVTVGNRSSVICSGDSTCHVTCTGPCSITCSGDSSCTVRCGMGGVEQSVKEDSQRQCP